MTEFYAGKCDIAVIGAGHAGIEAALAAARMGLDTICFAINLDSIGNMPCNPAIGGTGKGHLAGTAHCLCGGRAKYLRLFPLPPQQTGKVLLLAGEDDPGKVLKARLLAGRGRQ